MPYIFRRADNEHLFEVDFATMIEQDALGYITLTDGVQARRCRHLEAEMDSKTGEKLRATADGGRPIVSDALGFPQHQLAAFEQDRTANGFSGVEFVRDPLEPTFYQVKISSPTEWQRYIQHRGMSDRNSTNGGRAMLTADQLAAAEQRAKETSPEKFGEIFA